MSEIFTEFLIILLKGLIYLKRVKSVYKNTTIEMYLIE